MVEACPPTRPQRPPMALTPLLTPGRAAEMEAAYTVTRLKHWLQTVSVTTLTFPGGR